MHYLRSSIKRSTIKQGMPVIYFSDSSAGLKSLFLIALPCSLLLVLFSMYSFFKHFLISRSRSLQRPKNFRMLWFLWHSLSKLIKTLHSSVCKCGDKSGCIFRRWRSTAGQPALRPHRAGWSRRHQRGLPIQRPAPGTPGAGQLRAARAPAPSTADPAGLQRPL